MNTVCSQTNPNRHDSTRLAMMSPKSDPSAAIDRFVPPSRAARPSGTSARQRDRQTKEATGRGTIKRMAGTPRVSDRSDTARNSTAVSKKATGR